MEAMKVEVEVLVNNNTWEVVTVPKGNVPIRCRWVYKNKHKSDGITER